MAEAPRSSTRPRTALIVGGCLVAVGIAVFAWYPRDGYQSAAPPVPVSKAWYTVDDGVSWFADDDNRITPFDHQGKKAYRCYVWTCDGGKTQFVSHLERLKATLLKNRQATGRLEPGDLILSPMDVKPPRTGDAGWADYNTPAGVQIHTPRCPHGGTPTPVEAH